MDRRTGGVRPVFDTYPTYSDGVIQALADYPIAEYFGIDYTKAMQLPVNEWHQIREAAIPLAAKKHAREQKADPTDQFIKVIEQLLLQQASRE